MMQVGTAPTQGARAALTRVEAWRTAHLALWDFWSDAWERKTGHPLRLTDGRDDPERHGRADRGGRPIVRGAQRVTAGIRHSNRGWMASPP